MDDEKNDQFYLMRRLDPATRPVEDTWMSAGGVMLLLGGLILALDAFGRELLILSWLGDLQKPIGIALVVFGLAIIAARFVQGVPLSVLLRSNARSSKKPAAAVPTTPPTPQGANEIGTQPKP